MMKQVWVIATVVLLSACGVETAATGAALKKQEIEQGKKMLDQVQQSLDQSTRQMQQGAEQQRDSSQ
jgi:small-conductance mechanosensitive channel